MKKRLILLCSSTLSLVFLSSLSAFAAPPTLSGAEAKKLLTGKTVLGTAGKDIKFTKTYKDDGTYELEVRGEKSTGKWWIADDQYCQTRGSDEECYTVVKKGPRYLMQGKDGQTHTSFSVP